MEKMEGKKTNQLFAAFGPPDKVDSATNYSALFQSGKASRVLIYFKLNKHVYVDDQGTILGVLPPKTPPSP
jgi:hypothetical protein